MQLVVALPVAAVAAQEVLVDLVRDIIRVEFLYALAVLRLAVLALLKMVPQIPEMAAVVEIPSGQDKMVVRELW